MCHKENKYLFFDIMKNDQIFPSKVCHFQYDHRNVQGDTSTKTY